MTERIKAGRVRAGVIAWNPYGGSHGRLEVESEPMPQEDGTVHFLCNGGKVARWRPDSDLILDRAAMERRDAELAAQHEPGE